MYTNCSRPDSNAAKILPIETCGIRCPRFSVLDWDRAVCALDSGFPPRQVVIGFQVSVRCFRLVKVSAVHVNVDGRVVFDEEIQIAHAQIVVQLRLVRVTEDSR